LSDQKLERCEWKKLKVMIKEARNLTISILILSETGKYETEKL